MKTYIHIALIFVIVLQSCKHEPIYKEIPNEEIDNNPDPIGNTKCDKDSIYFKRDVLPIILGNCAISGCHGDGSARNGVDLTSYEMIIATADIRPFDPEGSDLYEVITDPDPDDRMPRGGKLSDEQITAIEKWIRQGAKNNDCEGCNTTNVSFEKDISPLINNSCVGCHGGSNPRGGFRLTTYDEVKTLAASGALLGAVSHKEGYVPMPYNQSKLGQCSIDQISIWIKEGMLNN